MTNKPTHIGIIYIPPEGSTYYTDTDYFDCLQQEVATKMCSGPMFIIGDFNSRNGELLDYIPGEGVYDFPPLEAPRNNYDKKINNYGKKLIELCKYTGVQIINGRHPFKDKTYKPTCFKYNGNSTVDYLITSAANARFIRYFNVSSQDVDSDHSRITFVLEGT